MMHPSIHLHSTLHSCSYSTYNIATVVIRTTVPLVLGNGRQLHAVRVVLSVALLAQQNLVLLVVAAADEAPRAVFFLLYLLLFLLSCSSSCIIWIWRGSARRNARRAGWDSRALIAGTTTSTGVGRWGSRRRRRGNDRMRHADGQIAGSKTVDCTVME